MISDVRVGAPAVAEPSEVVNRFQAAWGPGDFATAMPLLAEDSVYNLYLDEGLLPAGGQMVGRAAIEAALRRVRGVFEYVLYRPFDLVANGNEVRQQVEFMCLHRASGETVSGRFRLVLVVENGQIVRTDEYHDRAKVEAFMRLFAT